MTDVLERSDTRTSPNAGAKTRLKIIDCDIHPSLRSRADLNPFLSKRWQEHLETYGSHLRTPFTSTTPYPRSAPLLSRRDAWPPTGGPPGSDLAFMRQQHLDAIDIEFGLLQVLDMLIPSQQNLEFGAAVQRAINEWQIEVLVQARAASQGLDRRRTGQCGGGGRRDRALRGDRQVRAGQHLAARQRAARTAPLLADLRGGAGGGAAARHPRRRLRRPRADGRRLALLLQRGASFQRPLGGGPADEPRDRGRPGALPQAQVRLHRGRLRLGAGHHLAHGQALAALQGRGAARQAAAVGVRARAFLVHDATDRGAGQRPPPARRHRVDRRRPAAVLVRLSALGLRRRRASPSRRRSPTPSGRRSSTPTRAPSTSSAERWPATSSPGHPRSPPAATRSSPSRAARSSCSTSTASSSRCSTAARTKVRRWPRRPASRTCESDEPGVFKRSRVGEMLRCAWHGWEFDMRTGQSYFDPQHTRVRTYPVKVEAGETLAKGPYVAETFPVSVEENYVLIEV